MRLKIDDMVRVRPGGTIEIFGSECSDRIGDEAARKWLEDNEFVYMCEDRSGEIWFRHTPEERAAMNRAAEEMAT